MNLDLFDQSTAPGERQAIGAEACVLRAFALSQAGELLPEIARVEARAAFRHMLTPGGRQLSVALTNCGTLGWLSDRGGYRYGRTDPLSNTPWPPMPAAFQSLATRAAEAAGFPAFEPDACLINQYLPGNQLSLHQDKNERDFSHPIVSVSLGLPATFLFGGFERGDKATRIPLLHGDVVVWGGADRLRFHGVSRIKPGNHPLLGARRINFTFRRAG